jgi:hypothetical protein
VYSNKIKGEGVRGGRGHHPRKVEYTKGLSVAGVVDWWCVDVKGGGVNEVVLVTVERNLCT